jgi:hypothetical protein
MPRSKIASAAAASAPRRQNPQQPRIKAPYSGRRPFPLTSPNDHGVPVSVFKNPYTSPEMSRAGRDRIATEPRISACEGKPILA